MSNGNGAAAEVSADDFRAAFARVRPLVEKEWPSIDAAAIEATAGQLDALVELVSRHSDKARDAIRAQLLDLHALATKGSRFDRLEAMVDRLEKRTREIADKVRRDYVPKAETKIRENLWTSLFMALGLGVLIGLILRLGGRRRG